MDIKELLTSFAQITVFAVMLSMGMALRFEGIGRLWRRPALLLRCWIAAFVIVPLAAMAVTWLLPLSFETRLGIAAMAIIPGAPVTYRKMVKGSGDKELAGSFQATMALLSIVLVPVWLSILAALYPTDASIPITTVSKQVMVAQFIPLLGGAALSQWLPELTAEYEKPLFRISGAMLVGVVLLVLTIELPLVLQAGGIPVLAIVLMATIALLSGHILGGPDPRARQTIAIANATRNAGLAIMLVTLNFPTFKHEVLLMIVTYAVISAISGAIYTRLYNQRLAHSPSVHNAGHEV